MSKPKRTGKPDDYVRGPWLPVAAPAAGRVRVGGGEDVSDLRLHALQAEVGEWVRHNFGDAPMLDQAAVVAEEAGELLHHVLKQKQGIRKEEDHVAGMRDAVADVVIACLAFGAIAGIDVEDAVRETWLEVSQRDWTQEDSCLEQPS